ncbi:MAG: efflux RND transporter periplasmic adaptor subunit [Deltaproteobacteria bacterium]|nr:efflux RND transporter periplasmic adaptor subunit [Deltaproteobacteria bacterium]
MTRIDQRRPCTLSVRTSFPALAVIAVLAAAGCEKKEAPQMPPPEVLVAPVAQRNVPVYSDWVGTIEGYVNAEIRPKVQGYLLTQNYASGKVVSDGELLFQIDPRQFKAALDQAIGQLESAKALQVKTQLDVNRYRPLAKEGAVSEEELDNAIQQNEANKATVFQAQANVEQARLNLDWAKVNSPIKGIAGINQAQIGDLVDPTTVLTTVSTVDPIKVEFPISEQEYLRFAASINKASEIAKSDPDAPKLEAILADGATHPHPGTFYAVNRQVDQRTGTLLVQALFPNPGNVLRPGGYAKVRAATQVADGALLVPQRAVLDLQGTYQVYVLNADDTVTVRDVTPGPRSGSDWVITKGLSAGEKIVVEGLQKVRSGVKVIAKPAPPSEAPGIEPAAPATGGTAKSAKPS